MISDDELRRVFEKMHAGRDLTQHRLRGTYIKPKIAALWNQHVRTARFMEEQFNAWVQANILTHPVFTSDHTPSEEEPKS